MKYTCLAMLLMVSLFLGSCGGNGGGTTATGSMVPPITAADIDYAFTALNAMRMAECPGCMPFVRVGALDTYATTSNDVYDGDRLPHTHFMATGGPTCPAALPPAAVGSTKAENEGIVGVGFSNMMSIDAIPDFYLMEKPLPPGDPGRGHYEAIINPGFRQVGIAIKRSATDGFFLMTQEFCD